ncbi:hypothetical protein ASG46_06085 [Bacillus sp. Leaf49]|uniref:hypothetical protein n=1 Tax=Bacillus sp. Leaf49 TaxID=1736222 RepID=UPI0006F2E283|nr:hypothetical protein [Bacillus sp. Leaf49]KQU12105.1 hypothetical protein ASG46_06085 [Bacillus sp. Leaf49]
MDSNIISRLKDTQEKIQRLQEQINELKTELIGAVITYKNRDAVIIHVDWANDSILLNVDETYEEDEEWVSFK